jgi:two-component system sensor histidine kinase BaeS
MRLGIRQKLFLAFAATAGLVVAALLVWHHWSFHYGFLAYVNEAELARLDALRDDLEASYAASAGWDFVDERERWLAHVFIRAGGDADSPRASPWHARRPDAPRRAAAQGRRDHGFGITERLSLHDAAGSLLAGVPQTKAHSARRDIRYDGKVVGYVELAPIETLSDRPEVQFATQQRDALYVAAIAILVVAAVAAAIFARSLGAPIGELARGTHALAQGRYETRIALEQRDELGRLAEHFNALAQTLERNREARKQWVADISHELRTPIAILRAELEALEDGVRPLDASAIRSLSAEVARLGSLVDDLYELARSDAGALTYSKQVIDLRSVLDETVAAFRERYDAARLGLELHRAGAAPVLADADRLRQLFANLLENSLRYTDAGGGVRITQALERNRVRVSVEDSAPGVPDEALGRLFDRLYRVDPSRSRETGAAGLGLAICAGIVKAHGGTIGARHSPLGGVAIDLELPLHENA